MLCFTCHFAMAQVDVQRLIGSWVLTKVTYSDGSELPDERTVKYAYIKYSFRLPDKLNASSLYYMNGTSLLFEVIDNTIYFKSTVGGIINALLVEKIDQNNLVLLQQSHGTVQNPAPIKFYFTRETVYQDSLPVSADDIISARKGDTVYKMTPKIYPAYKGDSFQTSLYNAAGKYMHSGAGHLVASFTVAKNGVIDSAKILEGISPDVDKQVLAAINSSGKSWTPGKLNGKYVSVRMVVELRYGVGDIAIPASFNSMSATSAYNAKAYDIALYYFDLALRGAPFDQDNLYKRGMCKLLLGNTAGACADWKKIKELGGSQADALLAKYCK